MSAIEEIAESIQAARRYRDLIWAQKMGKWKFEMIKTQNGVFQTTAYGVASCGFDYVVLAKKELDDGSFYGLYGYGNTEEEAMKEAKEKARNFVS